MPDSVRLDESDPDDVPPHASFLWVVYAAPDLLLCTGGRPNPYLLSSPRDLTTRGSCGSRSAPGFAQSPACAFAILSTVPGDSRNDVSFVPGPRHSTRAVRSPDSSVPDTALPGDDARAS